MYYTSVWVTFVKSYVCFISLKMMSYRENWKLLIRGIIYGQWKCHTGWHKNNSFIYFVTITYIFWTLRARKNKIPLIQSLFNSHFTKSWVIICMASPQQIQCIFKMFKATAPTLMDPLAGQHLCVGGGFCLKTSTASPQWLTAHLKSLYCNQSKLFFMFRSSLPV